MIMFRNLTMNKLLVSYLLIILLIPAIGLAQSNDTKLWTGLAIEKDINKKLKGSIELEQRLDNNISSFDRLLIEPAISYELNKRWSIDLIYRLWYQQTQERDYNFHNRVSMGISYSKVIKGIKFKVGSKMQYGLPDSMEDDYFANKRLVSRNNIKVSYAIFGSRFTPYLKYELFTLLKRFNPHNYQWRSILGTRIYVNAHTDIQLFYMLEHEYNVVNRMDSNILGISLRISL